MVKRGWVVVILTVQLHDQAKLCEYKVMCLKTKTSHPVLGLASMTEFAWSCGQSKHSTKLKLGY